MIVSLGDGLKGSLIPVVLVEDVLKSVEGCKETKDTKRKGRDLFFYPRVNVFFFFFFIELTHGIRKMDCFS